MASRNTRQKRKSSTALKEESDDDKSRTHVKTLHHEMIRKLSENISADLTDIWKPFTDAVSVHIYKTALATCKDIFDVCNKLLSLGKIHYGEYQVLLNVFKAIEHTPCQDIVSKYSRKIQETQIGHGKVRKISEEPSADTSDKVVMTAEVRVDEISQNLRNVYRSLLETTEVGLRRISESRNLSEREHIEEMEKLHTVSAKFVNMFDTLEKKGITIRGVQTKCLLLIFELQSRQAVENLWALYKSKDLLMILKEGLITEELLKKFKVNDIQLVVDMSEKEYQKCLEKSGMVSDFSEESEVLTANKGIEFCLHHHTENTLSCADCAGKRICQICLSTSHKGHQYKTISQLAVEKKNDIHEYLKKAENTEIPMIKEKLVSIDAKIKENSDYFKKLESDIKLQREEMKADIDRNAQKLVEMSRELQKNNFEMLTKCKQEVQSVYNDLNETITNYKKILELGNEILVVDTEMNLQEDSKLPDFPNLKIADFLVGRRHEYLLGELHVRNLQGVSIPGTVKFYFKFKHITSVEKSISGSVWLSNELDYTITLSQEGNLLQKIKFCDKVHDISVSTVTGNLWVCCEDNIVYEVLGETPIERFITDSPWSLCMTPDDNVVIGSEYSVTVYSTVGDVLHSTQRSGQHLISFPAHITVCTLTGDIAVCDIGMRGNDIPHVSVFNSKLEMKYQYYSAPKSHGHIQTSKIIPVDAVYDSHGHLLIADSHNKCIHLISGEGQFLTAIHSDDAVLPTALTMIHDGLVCVAYGSRGMKMIKYRA